MTERTRTALVIFACLILLWFGWQSMHPAGPDAGAVLIQIKQLNQLVTVRYTIQKVVALEEPRPPLSSERILLVLQARLEAGVDLSQLQPRDVDHRPDGTVTIRLPAAQILSAAVDEKETRVWDRQKTWWTPWIPFAPDMEKKARILGLDAARQAAVEMGILKQAEASADSAIRGLLGLAGVKKIVVIRASSS